MDLSVVVPTLNGREQLARCLDALAERAPDAEIIVVNGPSADGTTGMVHDRSDVDVLVQISDRTLNVARNAGITRASGDVVALVDHRRTVTEGWRKAIAEHAGETPIVTGPTHQPLRAGIATETVESRTIAGRSITYFNGGNVAFDSEVLEASDGFDEYLQTGGARDLAHRLVAMDYSVSWSPSLAVQRECTPDGGVEPPDWGWKYRSLAYRLAKNYGPRPTVIRRLTAHAGDDAFCELKGVVTGSVEPSKWIGTGRDVLYNLCLGLRDGLAARFKDRSARRNPRGCSARSDRAVEVYDWR
jgi:glycosyltransferase involved in cell wall biosynthesis